MSLAMTTLADKLFNGKSWSLTRHTRPNGTSFVQLTEMAGRLRTDWPVAYPDGHVVYDRPEALPSTVKAWVSRVLAKKGSRTDPRRRRDPSVFEKHGRRIRRQNARMPSAMLGVMGGQSYATPNNLRGTFESIASGSKVFVTQVLGQEVYFRFYNGSNGNMPSASFLRQYRKVKEPRRATDPQRRVMGGSRSEARAREREEMAAILKKHGFHPGHAKKLQAEGMGPFELESRAKLPPNEVGGLTYTHRIRKNREERRDPKRRSRTRGARR